ncbi:MAG TPA: Fe-S cluster assembly protein HesB [Blastocatellia bacterium]|nr:Fe-S cluster assembly protein HesB [Blastocatellia bacterium]
MEILIPAPAGFSFTRTAISHGWSDLPPFDIDLKNWTITRVIDLGQDRAVTVTVSPADGGLKVATPRKLSNRAAQKVIRDVTHIFRLDDDMAAFYSLVAGEPDFAWISQAGAGRLLRSPTVFEDLVKTICTTNCSWALTVKMVAGMVNAIGAQSNDSRRGFPTPEAMAAQPESFYRDQARAGYRAPYLKELAERVASGSLDVEAWLTSDLPTAELKREMKQVKGVGDYAAENLLKLLGRYEGLALDSWVRAKFARTRNKGRAAEDKKIERYYGRFGQWRGLALWCDMTRDWVGEDGNATF